jgi:hypothetical protein
MAHMTSRRTQTHKVRRTISEILEQLDAIEYSVGCCAAWKIDPVTG